MHLRLAAATLLLAAGCSAPTCEDWADKQAQCLNGAASQSALQQQCEQLALSSACRKCVVDSACSAQASACASSCGAFDAGLRPLEELSGSAIDTWVQVSAAGETSTSSAIRDLSSAAVAAWEALPDGGLLKYPGTGAADGTFRVPGVPQGASLYVQVNATLVQTDARSLDLGANFGGRLDAVEATQPTPVAVQLSGLAPWGGTDQLELLSFNAGLYDFTFDLEGGADGGSGVAPGATDAGWGLDWNALSYAAGLLPEAAKGDEVVLLQLSGSSVQDGTLRTLSRYSRASSTTLADGQAGALRADLGPAGLGDHALAATWSHALYSAHLAEFGPGAAPYEHDLYLSVMPGAGQFGSYTFSGDLLYFSGDASAPSHTLAVSYPNPFPAGWDVVGTLYSGASVQLAVPAAAGPYTDYAFLTRSGPASALGGALDFSLTPARNVRVGAGASPEVTWEKPAVGSPTSYRVIAYQLYTDAPGGAPHRRRAATVVVDGAATRAVLPAELLRPGASYYVRVYALADAGDDPRHKPFRGSISYSSSDAMSTPFTP